MPRHSRYSREFIVALRARWAKRDTYKTLAEEIGEKPTAMNYLLNAPLDIVCGDCKESMADSSHILQTSIAAMFYVEQSGNGCTPSQSRR